MAAGHRRAWSISSSSLASRQERHGFTVLNILVSEHQVRWRNVEERLATHPSEVAQLDSDGCPVLLYALIRRTNDYPPFPIVRSILRASPKAIWEQFEKTTLLEFACKRLASLETLTLLCQARPAIPEDTSAVCALWVNYCCHYGDEENFVRLLKSGSPEAYDIGSKFQLLLKYVTTEQLLPCRLHTAASSQHSSLELFRAFCRVFPDQLDQIVEGNSPLHAALSGAKDSPNQRSKALFLWNRRPESINCRGSDGRLPLHLAIECGIVDATNIKSWSRASKAREALSIPDPVTGFFPFQTAALPSSNASVSTIYQLLRPVLHVLGNPLRSTHNEEKDVKPTSMPSPENPEGISSGLTRFLGMVEPSLWDELHQTLRTPVDPLWHQLIGAARVSSCPPKLVELLISMHPEKLQHADQKGWLPLHHAVATQQGDQSEIICMILEANPAAAYQSDKRGYLPFHLACLSGKGTWLLHLLKPYNPGAIYQPDGVLGLPAVLLAAQSPRATLSDVFYLLTSSPDICLGALKTKPR